MPSTVKISKTLSPYAHGIVDYVVAAVLLIGPTLFGFGGVAETLSYALAAAHTALSLTTAYPLGALKLIPFRIHGYIELAAAAFLLVAPWLFRFDTFGPARNFFLLAGASVVVTFLATRYATTPEEAHGSWRHRAAPAAG